MPKGGKIEVSARLEKDRLEIEFKDTGSGIEEKDLSRIFEPFYTTKDKGSGLGLWISNEIIKRHGGEIRVKNREDRKGTCFNLSLPYGRPEMKRKIQEKILVADDELRMCESLKTLLSNSGYEVETVQDGEEAIRLINENNFDLILADIKMPKVNGVDILRKAKSKDKDNLVILMTGYGSLDTAIQAIEEGAYDYFLKPIEFQELERAIKRGLEKRKVDSERKKAFGRVKKYQ